LPGARPAAGATPLPAGGGARIHPHGQGDTDPDQPKVAVIFHGASGALQGLAKEVAAGAEEEGAVARVRRVADHEMSGDGATEGLATPDDVRWADGVIFGSPSRYGNVASQLKSYVETLEVRGGDSL